jgi:aryl sulfotransferase
VGPPIEPPPDDIRKYWQDWTTRDGHPLWPFWENIRSGWQIRNLPNAMLVHFASLKIDMPIEFRRIAASLETRIDESRWNAILEHCSFEWMKNSATKSVSLGGAFRDAGAEVFINRGVSGRWSDTSTPEESTEYEKRAEAELGSECVRWACDWK